MRALFHHIIRIDGQMTRGARGVDTYVLLFDYHTEHMKKCRQELIVGRQARMHAVHRGGNCHFFRGMIRRSVLVSLQRTYLHMQRHCLYVRHHACISSDG